MNYFVNKNYVTIILNEKTSTIFKSENPAEYDGLIKVLASTAENKISQVTDILNKISKFHEYMEMLINQTHVAVKDNDIYIDNKKLSNAFATHIRRQMDQGEQIAPFVNFINNLMKNPNKDIIDQISDFVQASLEDNGFTISADGYLYAYKKVRNDYLDIHSQTYLNIPGSIHSMNRNDVEYDRSATCSAGLHFCAWSYLDKFCSSIDNSRIIMVKIHPADIVSIPYDYNNAKGRCCRYEVVGEFNYSEPTKKSVLHDKEVKSNTIVYNNITSLQEKLDAYYNAYNNTKISDAHIVHNLANIFTAKEFNELYSDFVFEFTKCYPELKIPKKAKLKYFGDMLKADSDTKCYDDIRNFHNFLLKKCEKQPNVLTKLHLDCTKSLAAELYNTVTLKDLCELYNIIATRVNTNTLSSNIKCSKVDIINKLFNMCGGPLKTHDMLRTLKGGN